jgi:transcriptional regulator with XRE-family HTH domain
MRSVGEILKEERHRLRMNQNDFAAVGGLNQRTLLRYEQNTASPDCEFLRKLAQFGVDVHYIITGVREISDIAPEEQKLLAMYRSLDPTSKKGVWGMLNGILSDEGDSPSDHLDTYALDESFQ